MTTSTTKALESGLLGKVIAQFLVLLVCVVAPVLITAVAPVSWIKFQRQGDRVSARAETCLLFFIPYRTTTVDSVTGVSQRTKSGSVNRYRRTGTDKYVQSESEGFLSIQGSQSEAVVSVTPADIKAMTDKAEAFLKDPQAAELKLFVVANWKFSVIFGGLASLLTVLYVFGVVAALVQFLLRSVGIIGKSAKSRSVSGLP